MTTAPRPTWEVAARVMMDARIGPTQGVHTRPSDIPIANPPLNPFASRGALVRFARREARDSQRTRSLGIVRTSPKTRMVIAAIFLRVSPGSPVARTIEVRNRVKKVKLMMNPETTPSGRFFPSWAEAPRTIGRSGRIQGERMVTSPPKKAKRIRMGIV